MCTYYVNKHKMLWCKFKYSQSFVACQPKVIWQIYPKKGGDFVKNHHPKIDRFALNIESISFIHVLYFYANINSKYHFEKPRTQPP